MDLKIGRGKLVPINEFIKVKYFELLDNNEISQDYKEFKAKIMVNSANRFDPKKGVRYEENNVMNNIRYQEKDLKLMTSNNEIFFTTNSQVELELNGEVERFSIYSIIESSVDTSTIPSTRFGGIDYSYATKLLFLE